MPKQQLHFYIAIVALILSVVISTTSVAYSIAAVKDAKAQLTEAISRMPQAEGDAVKPTLESLERAVAAHGRIMREMVKGMSDIRQDYADRLGKLEAKIDTLPIKGRR
jgi:type IV secretory pathway VirB6-like protein